jgi:hypothetical protein
MAEENRSWTRQSEAFWRAHHEAWKRINGSIATRRASRSRRLATGERNLKPSHSRNVSCQRRGLSHSLSHTLSHTLSLSEAASLSI